MLASLFSGLTGAKSAFGMVYKMAKKSPDHDLHQSAGITKKSELIL